MNRIFRIIWSKTRLTWVVASENSKRRGKGGGAVDERATAFGLARDRDGVQDPPPALAWQLRLGSLLALLALCRPTHAIDYYWDVDGGTAGAGGTTPTGTWSTGGATLSTNVNGATATGAVTTTTADRLFFSAGTDATGAYTVTVNGTQNIGRLTFQEGTVNLSGGTINFGAVSGLIDGDATTDTISSVITGTNGVRFSGGTRRLTGTNTYSGQTVLGGSGLAQAAVILAAPGGNAVSGNSLQLGGGNYTSAGFVTLGAAEQINDTATVTLSSGHYSGSSIFSLNGFDETIGGINLGHQGNGSSVTFRNGAATDATVTLVGSGTYTTVIGDRSGGRSLQNGGAGRLNVVVALTGAGRPDLRRKCTQLYRYHNHQQRHAATVEYVGLEQQRDPERRHAQPAPDGNRNSRDCGRKRRDAHAFPDHQRRGRDAAKDRRRHGNPERQQHLPGRHSHRSGHSARGLGHRLRQQLGGDACERRGRDDGSQQFQYCRRLAGWRRNSGRQRHDGLGLGQPDRRRQQHQHRLRGRHQRHGHGDQGRYRHADPQRHEHLYRPNYRQRRNVAARQRRQHWQHQQRSSGALPPARRSR